MDPHALLTEVLRTEGPGTNADKALGLCDNPECAECAVLCCPSGDALHFHHDGCPSCDALEG